MFFPSLVIDDDRDSVSGLKLLYCTYIRCQAEDKTVAGKIGEISVRTPPFSLSFRVTTFLFEALNLAAARHRHSPNSHFSARESITTAYSFL